MSQMQQYIGTKLIRAKPMPRLEYNQLRGLELPADENGADDGYLVEYIDGGKGNHPDYTGYISWSPKDVFERAYHPTDGMDFGMALRAMRQGKRVARAGWNGKGMFLFYVAAYQYAVAPILTYATVLTPQGQVIDASEPKSLPWIAMKTADNGLVPWLASQTDMLAMDWRILPLSD